MYVDPKVCFPNTVVLHEWDSGLLGKVLEFFQCTVDPQFLEDLTDCWKHRLPFDKLRYETTEVIGTQLLLRPVLLVGCPPMYPHFSLELGTARKSTPKDIPLVVIECLNFGSETSPFGIDEPSEPSQEELELYKTSPEEFVGTDDESLTLIFKWQEGQEPWTTVQSFLQALGYFAFAESVFETDTRLYDELKSIDYERTDGYGIGEIKGSEVTIGLERIGLQRIYPFDR